MRRTDMHRTTPASLLAAALSLALAVSGVSCRSATPLMETSARTAADQLADLEAEIARKIKRENEYTTQAQEQMTSSLVRDRGDQFQLLLAARARAFADQNRGSAPSGDTLNGFMTGFVDQWNSQESQLQSTLQSIAQQLDQGRQALELNAAKVKELQNKLRALGQARTKGELARFVFEFADGTLSQLATDIAGTGDAGTADTPAGDEGSPDSPGGG